MIVEKSVSPSNLIKKLEKTEEKVVNVKKKLKLTQQKNRRLNEKVSSMKSLINKLKSKELISANCEDLLEKNFSGVPLDILKRASSTKNKSGNGLKYSSEIRSFALTLQFYSTKAYEFVRKSFDFNLPHQSTIRQWYSHINAEPGFTRPAFNALALKVEEAKHQGVSIVCSLMLDEMAVKKHVTWDGTRFRGYVDIGNEADDDDSLPIAKDALVFMVVALNASWKVPIAYFFIDGMSGAERANLITVAVKKLYDTGVNVVSLTCDGPSCHFTMMKALGAKIEVNDMQTHFMHPSDSSKRIHVIFDVCHMLKLVRNTLGQGGILTDEYGKKIRWQYITELEALQSKEGLRLKN